MAALRARNQQYLQIGLILLFFSEIQAVAGTLPKSSQPRTVTPPTNKDCETLTDNDLYGKGVRVGLYMQWSSGFILQCIDSFESASRIRTTNTSICAAIAIATMVNVVVGHAHSLDYFLTYFLITFMSVGAPQGLVRDLVNDINRHLMGRTTRPAHKLASTADLSIVFQGLLTCAYIFFGVWFWLTGMDTRTIPTNCGKEKIAIPFLVGLRNPSWVKFAAVMSALSGIWGLYSVFVWIIWYFQVPEKKGIDLTAFICWPSDLEGALCISPATSHRHEPSTPERRGTSASGILKPERTNILVLISRALSSIIAMVSVERTISVNGLVSAGITESAGQMISLVVGICSVLTMIYEVVCLLQHPGQSDENAENSDGTQNPAQMPQIPQSDTGSFADTRADAGVQVVKVEN